MTISIRAMSMSNYDAAFALWRETEGIGLSDSDSEESVRSFLNRNPGLSAVAASPSELVGAVLCGHDGRRGYLHHLAVKASHRKRGIASRLIATCLAQLAAERIQKCNVFLFGANVAGAAFWHHNGWSPRTDLDVFQKILR